ncbi:MAG: iron-sulfur cluster assembly scaffold protein [Desulfobulbaceae bacterium]|nr:iron-sulfur cluster assembly scaffold protein [Desulfobulbaceae bacterium]
MADNFDFWQDHSDQFLGMAYLYDRREKMENPDGCASKTGDCGDSITMYLQIIEERVEKLTFELDGCINTNACCNVVAELIEGKPLESCWQITPTDIIDYLRTLPADHHHCAELAVGTLYLALSDFSATQS